MVMNRQTSCALFLAVVGGCLLGASIAIGGLGWWTYSPSATVAVGKTSLTGNVKVDFSPVGYKISYSSSGTGMLQGSASTDSSIQQYTEDTVINGHKINCSSNSHTALYLTLAAAIICGLSVVVFCLSDDRYKFVGLLLFTASILSAYAIGSFIMQNACVQVFRENHYGAVGM